MKRGTSGLSCLVGIDKPVGMSSHDVVNRARRIFGEKRVGHMGTLDPMASGALLVCIGPATRLNPYMAIQDKRYEFKVLFGAATDTDDAEGEIIRTGPVPDEVLDPFFAQSFVQNLQGSHRQIPPVYSAIKVKGERSYKAARAGNIIELDARPIEIYEAALLGIEEASDGRSCSWDVAVHVSKGTYIRSLARDIGNALNVPAHVGALRRTELGPLDVATCHSLETLESLGEAAALDPVVLLGYRLVFARDEAARAVSNGAALPRDGLTCFSYPQLPSGVGGCSCTSGLLESEEPFGQDEILSVIVDNKLAGLYRYDNATHSLKPECIFAVGVSRGRDI